jgi:hypothetical protein
MTCKFNYRGVSLNYKTYSDLEDISTEIVPGKKLSQAKTVEALVNNFHSVMSYSQSNEDLLNGNNKQTNTVHPNRNR